MIGTRASEVRREPLMHVRLDIADEYIVCRLEGPLEWGTVGSLRGAMGLLHSVPRLVIDLSEVTFIDSAGVTALVAGVRRVRDNGGEAVVCSGRRVNRLLETIGFDRVVPVVGTVDEAAHLMGAPSALSGRGASRNR